MACQVVLDLGRRPEARFLNMHGGEYLREAVVTLSPLPLPPPLSLCAHTRILHPHKCTSVCCP